MLSRAGLGYPSYQAMLAVYTLLLPYLACGVDACSKQTPSAEAPSWAQCATPTYLLTLEICQSFQETLLTESLGSYDRLRE